MIETFYKPDCPVRFALLADFHNGDPAPVLASLRARKPDLILIAGDFVYGERPTDSQLKMQHNQRAAELLRGCAELAPTAASIGNHEYMLSDEDLEVIDSLSVTMLDNEWKSFGKITVGGLSSGYYPVYRQIREEKPEQGLYPKPDIPIRFWHPVPKLDWLDGFEANEGYKILLCHHPEYYSRYLKNRKIDLILSGHCHGGQWRYYSLLYREWRGVFAPGQGLFPKLTSGVHDDRLIISRGLTNTTRIPRINNPTEIIYCGM